MATDPRSDADARRRAVTDFETNLVVLAGAGTGKTSLLVERALNAIGSNVAGIGEIAAITFTEKAAGELRDRLGLGLDRLRALAQAEVDPLRDDEALRAWRHLSATGIDPGQVAARCLAALEQLDRAAVRTIHAFAADLLRAFPVEAGVDPSFAVDGGEAQETLLDSEWDAFVRDELGPRGPREKLWSALFAKLSLTEVEKVARGLGAFGVPDELLDPARGPRAEEIVGPDAARLVAEIDALLGGEPNLTSMGQGYFRSAREVLAAFAADGLAAFRQGLERHPDFANRLAGRRIPVPTAKIAPASVAVMKRLPGAVRRFCLDLAQIDEQLAPALLEAAAPFARTFREAYLRSGLASFDGLLILARDLLRDHPAVRRSFKERFRLLLVDEFQDTDPVQYEIVLFLAERSADAAEDPFRTELAPGRLFVVGDAKQSVYRFRGADYAAYRRTTQRILDAGGARIELLDNFRSRPGVLEPVNDLFTAVGGAWSPSDYQPEYTPIRAARGPAEGAPAFAGPPLPLFPSSSSSSSTGPAVELWTVDLGENDRAAARREAEGRLIAAEIATCVGGAGGGGGSAEYKHFTLLLRALTQVTPYLRALRERAIPFVVDGGRDFLRRPEVAQLMALLRVLVRPSDEPALLAFLRSPAGGASDVELAAWAGQRRPWNFHVPADAREFPGLARAFALLERLERETRDLPADAAVRVTLERSAMLPLGAAAYEGAQRVANLQKLVAAAGDLARDGRLSLEEVVDGLEEGRLEDVKTDRPLADDAANAVRITSIHRMKGLENEIVILPDMAREKPRFPFDKPPVQVVTLPDGSTAVAIATRRLKNPVRFWLDREEQRHEAAEETRVLYVALTRARERLIVFGGRAKRGEAPALEALRAWGYDPEAPPDDGALLDRGRVVHRRLPAPARVRASAAEHGQPMDDLVGAYDAAVAGLARRAKPPLAQPSAAGDDAPVESRQGRSTRDLGQAAGIVVHRLLERWPPSSKDDLARLCRETAQEKDVDVDGLSEEVQTIVEAFSKSALARRLDQIEILGREVPILLQDPGGPVFRGTIDLLYRERGGDREIVVADYKTDREATDAELRERYAAQLAVYARAAAGALGLSRPARAELWLLRDGRRIEVA